MTKRKYIQKKLKISERQKCSLMEIYDKYRYLTPKQVNALALILNLDTTQIRDWFNNERQKIRINVSNTNINTIATNNNNNNSTNSINNTNNKRQQTSRSVSASSVMSTTPIQVLLSSSEDTQSSNSSITKSDSSNDSNNLSPQIISSSLVQTFKIYKLTDNNQLIDQNNNINQNDSGSYATASALLLEETTKSSDNSELFKLNIDKTKLDELKLTFSLNDICNSCNNDTKIKNNTSLNVIKYNRFIDDNNDDDDEDFDVKSGSSTGRTSGEQD